MRNGKRQKARIGRLINDNVIASNQIPTNQSVNKISVKSALFEIKKTIRVAVIKNNNHNKRSPQD